MKFTKLCLVITDKCPASCDFCGFSCSPDKRSVMPSELMNRMIHEAKELGVNTISFSGGEPFLYPELLAEGIQAAKNEKFLVNIASNGFWGAWDNDKVKKALEKIKPDSIGFSYDFFHQKYISEEHFKRAIVACLAKDIKCFVHVADMKGQYSAGKFIKSLDNWKYGLDFIIYPAYRLGRAATLSEDMFITQKRPDNIGCLYENTLSVLYNGDVYPCCRYEAYNSAMKIGNVTDSTLKKVIAESDVPKICDVLMKNDRFQQLLDIAKEQEIPISENAGCSCDYCRMLFGTEEHKKKMLPYVEELYGEMLVRSLMREVKSNDY